MFYYDSSSGSQHDSSIFTASAFGQALQAGTLDIPPPSQITDWNQDWPYFFVPDEAFPLRIDILRPYPRKNILGEREQIFNYRLFRARRILENAFGKLTAR